jgi:ELWxxDGT repeat protein
MLIFAANNVGQGQELWRSDGTAGGAMMVKDIHPTGVDLSSEPANLQAIDNKVYFNAGNGVTGSELWRTDGTAAGTVLVQDIAPGSTGSVPFEFTKAGQRVFFTADTDSAGPELWALPLSTLPHRVYVPIVWR